MPIVKRIAFSAGQSLAEALLVALSLGWIAKAKRNLRRRRAAAK